VKIVRQGTTTKSEFSIRTAALSHVFTTEMCSLPSSVGCGGGQLCSCTAGDYCSTRYVSTVMPNNAWTPREMKLRTSELAARAAPRSHDHDTRQPLFYIITPLAVFLASSWHSHLHFRHSTALRHQRYVSLSYRLLYAIDVLFASPLSFRCMVTSCSSSNRFSELTLPGPCLPRVLNLSYSFLHQ
jgi:hypothetical protein